MISSRLTIVPSLSLEITMKEVWKDIVGYEDRYQVSNLGRVKSLRRKVRNLLGERDVGGVVLKPTVLRRKRTNRITTVIVRLYNPQGGKGHLDCIVARLVLSAFVGPCPDGKECCHEDGDPTNNTVTNLRWDTHASNMQDRENHGNTYRGSRAGRAKLTEKDIPVIRKALASGRWSMNRIGQEHEVDVATIRDIRDGKTWRHVE